MERHKYLVFTMITVLAVIASGCSTASSCLISRDTWYNNVGPYEREAVKVPFAEVTPEEARQLTKQNPPDKFDLKPYLVRALSYRQDTGAYSVSLGEKALYVSYGMLGKRNCYPLYREGIVVWLAHSPVAVDISTGIDE